MNNPLSDNIAFETGQTVARGIVQEAKKQIIGKKDDKKTDPVTGKPVPSKKTLTRLTQATAQLQQTKLKKVREELEKQRLRIVPPEEKKQAEIKKQKENEVIAQAMRNQSETGEFGRQVGG